MDSLSSADKQGGSYTFSKRVSAQEFRESLATQTIYIDNDENTKEYKKQIDISKNGLVIENIKAYSDKEQTTQIDCLNLKESIFVRAILNDENRVFYDETIQWAYYLKGISENLDKIDTKKAYKMDNVEGNDILFCIDLLNKQDKDTLLNNPQNYKLMLFAYFHKPAIKIGNKTPHIVLSVENSDVVSLYFNGKLLTIIINKNGKGIERIDFQAVSGRPQKVGDKHYFTYEKERQMLKNEGPIPEGEYYITPLSENIDDGVQVLEAIGDLKGSLSGFLSKIGIPKFGTFYGGSYAWGVIRIAIQPKIKTLTNSQGQTITRGDFFIHGGAEAGSAGCIDLWKNNNEFFKTLLRYVEQYKSEILKNQGKIPLIVEYESSTKIECDSEWQLQMQQGQTLPFKTPFLFTTNQCKILQ